MGNASNKQKRIRSAHFFCQIFTPLLFISYLSFTMHNPTKISAKQNLFLTEIMLSSPRANQTSKKRHTHKTV